uniref:Xin actin binding repeat containing 1 n=1 Tax=Vombatus ursinus TaxID=29139 RepID=A0A4X2L185_VOMUR
MAEGKVQASPAMTFPKTGEDTLALPPPPAQDELPLPPPKEAFSKFYQQRQANELRRLYRHIHPELRKNLEEAVVKDLAEVLEAEDPTEGDVQSMRWIFENWSLDAIGDHAPPQRLTDSEAVPAGDVRATSKKFEDGSFGTTDQAPAKPGPIRGDVQTVRWLFETRPMDTLTSQTDIQKAVLREPPPSGDVQGTRTLFETKPLDSLGCQPSTQEQSPLQLRSEIQELKGDVKKTVKLFQTEPLCAIQDAEGGIHEVKAACREEIQSTAVRTARWLFETRPLDAINRDPSQVRVIRGISLEEAARPDISNTRWLFETQPLDSIREVTIDEKDFQPSPDLIPPGPDVQQQRMLFETRALDTLKGEEAPEGAVTAKEEVIGGDVRSTLWLFETQALGPPSSKVQVGRLQQVGQRESEKGDSEIAGLELEKCPGGCASKMALSQLPAGDKEGKGDVKAFKKLFETLPLDSIGQEKAPVPTEESKLTGVVSAGQVQASQALFEKWPLYAIQDGQGGLHALTSVSREQVVGGDVQGFRWMFETQPLDRLGQDPEKVDVIRGITREEVMAGDVSSARWLFETQPLEVIHQQKKEKEGKEEEPPSAVPPKCNVQTIRWLFETHPLHALAGESRPEVTGTGPQADVRSYTWMFETQPREGPEGPGEQHLQVRQASLHTKDQQMEAHIFETEPLLPPYKLGGKDPVHYCSRVEIPVGQVSRRKEVFEAPEVTEGQKGQLGPVIAPEPVMGGSVRKFTWLFENCPMDCLEKAASGGIQEMPPEKDAPEQRETASGEILTMLHGTPGVLQRGGILIEAHTARTVRMAKYQLPSPGKERPQVQKEEVVLGELPRILRRVMQGPDVAPQGLLVQKDEAGLVKLEPLPLSALMDGSGHKVWDLLAWSHAAGGTRTGLVIQETEQGLVKLLVYSLRLQLGSQAASGMAERGSVQLLASCIEKGDLDSLKSLQWEPPTDNHSPAEGTATPSQTPLTASSAKKVIHVALPEGGIGCAKSTGPTSTQLLAKEAWVSPGPQGQGKHGGAQKAPATLGDPQGAPSVTPEGPGPDLQVAMQNLRRATAEAQTLQHQVQSKHRPRNVPSAREPPQNGQTQEPAPQSSPAPRISRVVITLSRAPTP